MNIAIVVTTLAVGAPHLSVGSVEGRIGLLIDGAPLEASGRACRVLQQGRLVLPVTVEAPWALVAVGLDVARKCGVTEVGFAATGAEPQTWLKLGLPGSPVLVLTASHPLQVVVSGVSAEVTAVTDGALAMLLKTFVADLGALVVDPQVTLRTVADLVRSLQRVAGGMALGAQGGLRLSLLLPEDRARLSAADQLVVSVLLDEPRPAGAPPAKVSGLLTQTFGASRAPMLSERQVPVWVGAGSQLCQAGKKMQAWGVGVVTGIGNLGLATTAADNRARAEIARLTAGRTQTSAGSMTTVTQTQLVGVRIADHWMDDPTVYALATKTVGAAPGPTPHACPSGTEQRTSWRWLGVDPDGKTERTPPPWLGGDGKADEKTLSFVDSVRSFRPLAETRPALAEGMRLHVADVLLDEVLAESMPPRDATGADCLLKLSGLRVAADAAYDTWFDPAAGLLFGRLTLPADKVGAGLPPVCASPANLDGYVARVRDRLQKESARLPVVVTGPVEYPDWVRRGSGAGTTAGVRGFFGVGVVSGILNPALARATADNRARAEIAKLFEVYVSASTTTKPETAPGKGDGTQDQAVRTLSAVTLTGVMIVDHWYHPDGTVFALAALSWEDFQKGLDKAGLSEAARAHWRANGEVSFKELAGE